MTDTAPIRCPLCASRLVQFSGWMFDHGGTAHSLRWCPECGHEDEHAATEAFAIRQVLEHASFRAGILAAADALADADGITAT